MLTIKKLNSIDLSFWVLVNKRKVYTSIKRTWHREERRGLGAEPPEKYSKACPLHWLKMHLPIVSLLCVTMNFDCSWQLLARPITWKKVSWSGIPEFDSYRLQIHFLSCSFSYTVRYAISSLRSSPIICKMRISINKYTLADKYKQSLKK